ncbi:MAG TPA: hypothetical protein PK926_07375 [Spirochaetota bacterium]|nr:hypothetical protein [Spirochaetota bacterium]HPI89321.1 hypothetical protein [Spirochaetota bacterium]HPR49238.1 hypothetical protein [Spirochaetota bacterium]
MKHKKLFFGFVALAGILLVLFALLFGKLFPFSPLAIGFTRHELRNVTVYLEDGSGFSDYSRFDTFTSGVEAFHRLKFLDKPRIYIFSDRGSYLRKNFTKARFCAYPNSRLVVSPWAVEEAGKGIISLEIYLKHELSHVLLYQHMDYLSVCHYPQWLMEGIAVYSAGQMGSSWYPDKKKTYEIIKKGNYFPPYLYKTSGEDEVKLSIDNRIAFMYSEFACVVDFIIKTYGNEKFYHYMHGLLKSRDHDKLFKDIFNIDYYGFLDAFVKHASSLKD